MARRTGGSGFSIIGSLLKGLIVFVACLDMPQLKSFAPDLVESYSSGVYAIMGANRDQDTEFELQHKFTVMVCLALVALCCLVADVNGLPKSIKQPASNSNIEHSDDEE